MKSVAIILVGLMLMLGEGVARAATGSHASSSAAVTSNHLDPLLDDPASSAVLSPDTYLDSGVHSDTDMLDSQPVPVLDYAISPQVTIDLACRPFAEEENNADFASDSLDVTQIAQSFMLGFRYKF
jgi:hypothetical protein